MTSTMYSPAEIMRFFPLFDRELADFLSEIGELKTFKEGEVLMKTGQYFKASMLLVSGRVKLYREGEDGNEFFMYFLEGGNACALSMICATRNQASGIMAVAVEDTEVIMIPIRYMDQLMTQYKSWYYFVLETYRNRFEELLVVIDNIAFKNMDERLEWYLRQQAAKIGNHLSLTHQQIANDLNSSREVISRLLKKMERNNRLILHRNHIEWIG
ncbi:MAG: Crp/Fnr family transcriptional regulator [Chitinophagaceae bacterium]|jgi:CRP/FNR family transcriptional regulator|nr:Crp/Fnr family transcriptional regulator [Chitinophagaceae bacterium]